jgi:predicted choloylglycine hydrolase
MDELFVGLKEKDFTAIYEDVSGTIKLYIDSHKESRIGSIFDAVFENLCMGKSPEVVFAIGVVASLIIENWRRKQDALDLLARILPKGGER